MQQTNPRRQLPCGFTSTRVSSSASPSDSCCFIASMQIRPCHQPPPTSHGPQPLSCMQRALPEKQRLSSTQRRPMRTGCSLPLGMVRETMSSFSASVASLDGENSLFALVLTGSRSIDDAAMVRLAVGRLTCLRNRSTVSEDTGYQTPRTPGYLHHCTTALHCTMTCPPTRTENIHTPPARQPALPSYHHPSRPQFKTP